MGKPDGESTVQQAIDLLRSKGCIVLPRPAQPDDWRKVYARACKDGEMEPREDVEGLAAAQDDLGLEGVLRMLEAHGFEIDQGSLRRGPWGIRLGGATLATGRDLLECIEKLVDDERLIDRYGQPLFLAALLLDDAGWALQALFALFQPFEIALLLGDVPEDEDDDDFEDDEDDDEGIEIEPGDDDDGDIIKVSPERFKRGRRRE